MAGATKKLLRIGIFDAQTNQRVDERVIRAHGDITFGTNTDNTFVVKGSQYPKRVKLFEGRPNGEYAVVFEKGQDGKIDVSGTPETLVELAKHKTVTKKGNQYVLPVPVTVRGRVALSDLVMRFQFVDAPVMLARTADKAPATSVGLMSQIDWPFVYIMTAAFILLGGTTTGLEVWWSQTGQYYYQPIQEGRGRLYELIKAEVQKPAEKEDEKPKEPEDKPEEDPNATAEAEVVEEAPPAPEPEKKKVQAVKKAAQAAAKSSAGDRAKDRAKVAAAVRQKTFLHVLGSNTGGPGGELDTLRRGAHTAALNSAFDEAGGVTTDRSGNGGAFAASGPEAVAAGDGDGTGKYKGLTAEDTGGSRIATSQVKTTDKADREVSIKANVGSGSISGQEGTGQIDRGSVTAVFSRRKGAIKSCYERVLKTNPNVKGKVTIKFTIGPAGRITSIDVTGNTTGDTGLGQCIIDKVRAWRFDPPSGGSVTFSYPFLLDAK